LPNAKLKKQTLHQKAEFQGKILGIRSSSPGYRLSYFLNKELGLSFQQYQPANGNFSKAEDTQDCYYYAEAPEQNLRFFLLPNKLSGGGNYLIAQYKQIDFIFVIENSSQQLDATPYLKACKNIHSIQAAFEISHDLFKPEKFVNLD